MALPQGYQSVTVYLPPDLAKFVAEYANSNGLTRKGINQSEPKPALGTAIVELLKSLANSEIQPNTLPNTLPSNGLSKDEILELIKEYSPTSNVPSEDSTILKDRINDLEHKIDEIKQEIKADLLEDLRHEIGIAIDALKDDIENNLKPKNSLKDNPKSMPLSADKNLELIELIKSNKDEIKGMSLSQFTKAFGLNCDRSQLSKKNIGDSGLYLHSSSGYFIEIS